MKFRNISAFAMTSGTLASLRQMKLRSFSIGFAALGLAAVHAPAVAQSPSNVETVEEAAVCLTLQAIIEDLDETIKSEQDWLEANRSNNDYSTETFNTRAERNNGKVHYVRSLLARKKRHCPSYKMSVLAQLCTSNSGTLSNLYPTDTCQRYRRRIGN